MRAVAGLRLQLDRVIEHARDALHDRQAEPEPARDLGALIEPVEFAEDRRASSIAECRGRCRRRRCAAGRRPDGSRLPSSRHNERDLILRGWNETAHAVAPATLPELFAAQAARTPGATAVVFGDERLTYAELDRRANRLAHHLRGLGVGPEVVVGLCVERSPEMVVGLIGILKAGGAYLPLDPAYPQARLAFMVADAARAGAGDAIGAARSASRARRPHRLPGCRRPAIARHPPTAPATCADPHHPAYVIYTSGSTGTPKGVVVAHAALSNFLLAMQEQVGLKPHDRLMAVTTIGFDIAAFELFLPLISGAGLALAAREVVQDPAALARAIAQSGSTIMQATPTLWHALATDGGAACGI